MAISKSTPYVRYKKNFTSNLHLGTIHVESEYLDRTQKTTIESIHGMTWHNKVVNENKELDLLSNLGFELTESKKEYFDVGEQRVSVDEIHGMQDIEPNEDGTYTYSVTSIEGEYAEIYDGLNHITSTSDGLDGNFEIVYDTDEEDITGSVVLDATMPNYTIEDSNIGELNDVVFKGETLVNILPQPSLRNKMENASTQRLNEGHDEVVVVDGEYKSAILKGQTLVNLQPKATREAWGMMINDTPPPNNCAYGGFDKVLPKLKPSTKYLIKFNKVIDDKFYGTHFSQGTPQTGSITKDYRIVTTNDVITDDNTAIHIYRREEAFNSREEMRNFVLDLHVMIIEYQEGMENWDIPYFTGMSSVKMPVLTTTGKNLITITSYDKECYNELSPNEYELVAAYHNKMTPTNLLSRPIYQSTVLTYTAKTTDVNKPIHIRVEYTDGKVEYSSVDTTEYSSRQWSITKPIRSVRIVGGANGTTTWYIKNLQLEVGSTATSYEPFKSNILMVDEEVELRGIGDVKDELNLLTGELTQRVNEIVLNGSEGWSIATEGDTTNGFSIYTSITDRKLGANVLCEQLPVYRYASEVTGKTNFILAFTGQSNVVVVNIANKTTKEEVLAHLKQNPIKLQIVTEPSIKTVDLTVTDQDNVVLETGKPRSYKDGHIQVQSNGVLPSSISYEVPSQNHMYVDMLKPSNTYTLKRNGENFEGSFFIDGTEYNTNVFMTSHQLSNKSLFINDMSEHDKVAMFEGNYGTSTIPYFEGMASVEMPILTTNNSNLVMPSDFERGYIDESTGQNNLGGYQEFCRTIDFIDMKDFVGIIFGGAEYNNNTRSVHFFGYDKYKNFIKTSVNSIEVTSEIRYIKATIHTPESPCDITKLQYLYISSKNSYEPCKSNTLTINEPIQLRGIGDIKDEYNVETGELTQRIGEVVFDGGENWKILASYTNEYRTNFIFNRGEIPFNCELICNQYATTNLRQDDTLTNYVYVGYSNINVFTKPNITLDEFKLQLQSNPLILQYPLATPIVKKVISTILDQDGKPTHSMHTYIGLTNLSTSSDTLIPNVSLDYEISSSTGTVTGTSATIENGENGSPISAIVYGESLVNVIQEPSDVECVVLGEHSGNNITIKNSVEGNIENAVVKGQTLVNLSHQKDAVEKAQNMAVEMCKDGKISRGKKYLFIVNFEKVNDVKKIKFEARNNGTWVADLKWVKINLGLNKYIIDIPADKEVNSLKLTNPDTSTESIIVKEFILLEYQEGMENWDIPYFEGMGSVEMPTLTTTGKNLFDINKINTNYHNYNDNSEVTVENNKLTIVSKNNERSYINQLEPLYLKPNTEYTFSITGSSTGNYRRVHFGTKTDVDNNQYKIIVFSEVEETKNVTFTTDDTGYLFIHFYPSTSSIATSIFYNMQLEEGSTATSYEPFKSNILTVNEEVELRGIGDVKDELDLVTGKLTQRIEKIELDILSIIHTGKNLNGNDRFLLNLKNSISNFNELLANNTINNHCFTYSPTAGYNYGENNSYYFYAHNQIYISFTAEKYTIETLRDLFDEKPFIIQLPTMTDLIRTIDLQVTDRDGNPTSLHSYNDTTHIATNSQGLVANVEISNPSYDVILKANTKYTLKLNRTNAPTDTPLEINLGGTEATMDSTVNNITITTPSTLANNKLTLGGVGNKFKEAMVIEGDCVDRDLDYFEGIVGVENPILMTVGKNLFDGELEIGFIDSEGKNSNSSTMKRSKNFIPIKPNTDYIFSTNLGEVDINFVCYDENKQYIKRQYAKKFTTPHNCRYLRLYNSKGDYELNDYQLQIEEGSTATPYEPYQGNQLATYPQVTLRSIGDIKDELDLVNETVTRRVGEVVLNGSEDWRVESGGSSTHTRFSMRRGNNIAPISNITFEQYKCNKFRAVTAISGTVSEEVMLMENYDNYFILLVVKNTRLSTPDAEGLKTWLSQNPTTVIYLITPTTESVYITPPTPRTSIASVALPTQLGESDYVTWNPYKEHYVHYNYEQDGSYTWENLTDLNERQFIELYDRRTYVEQEYKNTFLSHDSKGTSKYVLIEPNQDYTVTVRFSELPQCETVKVNLGGSEVEMNVSDPHVHVTTPSTLSNYLCSISGKGLSGKITDILVIHCLEHEGFADIEYFEGIDSIGEVVEVDGVPKSKIVIEQTNGNLLDFEPVVFNNGNYISMAWNENNRNIPLKPNTSYRLKTRKSKNITTNNGWGDVGARLYTSEMVNTRNIGIDSEFTTRNNEKYLRFYKQQSHNGNANIHEPLELTYAHFTDNELIRPRYYDKQEIILPIQLCRINTVYDNFYYDVIRGHYRIQQSIGHKYFTGADNENWTMIEKGQRILRFRYNNADIQIKSLGEYMTNRFTNGTATSPYESCAFNGSTFIISIDKERLTNATLTAFKEWLSSHNVHLYYQLASPMMIDLPQYSSKLELNTYKGEIYTFLKNCKPTIYTLDVPLDQTYRFYELQESQGYTNRIELTDERMTEEDALYINTIYGSGISNLIEEPNNVNTLLKPNYEGRATSHTLTNGKVSTISIHGFEPNSARVGTYNTVTKQYELTVKTTSGANNNSVVFPIPYALEQYEDGTHDMVYYNSEYKQWMFEGGQTLTVAYNSSTGVFTNAIEIFRGMTPRSGMIGEFKVKFASGTTSARLYYSLDGSTYTYTTLRSMTDGVEYYIAFFNTGGTKIDMGTKIGADSEYVTLVPLSGTMSEALMINQIQSITECTYYLDKTYYYTEPTKPIELTVYEGTNTITEDNGAIITIENNAHNKDALIYANTQYTVYWTHVGGQGNIKVTLGGVTQEVAATQGYVTITTSDADLEKGLLIGGFDVTIKDLMLVKGERIADLSYFEGSRAVGTAFIDEDGNTMYRITLVTGSELIQDKFEDVITFEDNKKHNVLVTKLLGTKPNKN